MKHYVQKSANKIISTKNILSIVAVVEQLIRNVFISYVFERKLCFTGQSKDEVDFIKGLVEITF